MPNVLVVDDSPTMRKISIFALKKYPHLTSVEANNGVEALEKLSRDDVVLIILDINMPEMDGLQFLEKIKQNDLYKDIPVIILTTEGREADRNRGMQAGATAYLVKPFQPPSLHAIIDKILKK